VSKPIDGLEPLPPPPPSWRPGQLVRADESRLERAVIERVHRVARAKGIRLEEAAKIVVTWLEAP